MDIHVRLVNCSDEYIIQSTKIKSYINKKSNLKK